MHQTFQSSESLSPLFSVVVLHYNQPLFWQEAVDSVLMQDYPNIELIFQDDGSSNFDAKAVEDYIRAHENDHLKRFVVQCNPRNLGTAGNCDAGVAVATGEYILLLDGDDGFVIKNALSLFAAQFGILPETENIVSANCDLVSIDRKPQGTWYSPEKLSSISQMTADQQYQLLPEFFFPVPSCTAFKRRIFELFGGFQVPYIRLCQDGYYFSHVLRLGQKFNLINCITSFHREGGVTHRPSESVSPNTAACMIEFMRILEFEFFPYSDRFSQDALEKLLNKYYENIIAYRIATNDLSYGISEPCYSLLAEWANCKNIPWYFAKSHLKFSPDSAKWRRPDDCALPIADMNKCFGCTACKDVCPVHAIDMREDVHGFLKPHIDLSMCVNCENCAKVCPANHVKEIPAKEPDSFYAVKAKDSHVRKASRSGGFFYVAAQKILARGGVVYGAAFDAHLEVHHIRVDQPFELRRLQGSKYVQSSMDAVYAHVILDLAGRKPVLFSGTPCQVAGLLHDCRLKRCNTTRLITIDTICHGVPSPAIYREYLDSVEHSEKANLLAFQFRDKEKGWRPHEESYTYIRNGAEQKKFSTRYTDLFYAHTMFRPSCHSCPYSHFARSSDITIADFWGIENAMPKFEDPDGVSLVMLRSAAGKKLFGSVRGSLQYRKTRRACCVQPNLIAPSVENPGADVFWAFHEKYDFSRLYEAWNAVKQQYPLPKAVCKPSVTHAGILTFHQAHNYGAMLQAWALQKYVRDLGIEADIINYRCRAICKDYKFIPWQLWPKYRQYRTPGHILTGLKTYWGVLKWQFPSFSPWWKRRHNFKHFLHEHLGCRGFGIPYSLLRFVKRDGIICGSDQIWALEDPAYFAAFPTTARRIAYAPSMGNHKFPPDTHKTINQWYHQFDAVSVRERTMADYLTAIFGGEPPQLTVDPTLLLKAADYTPVIKESTVTPRSYVFVYCVLENDDMVQMAQEYAKPRGLDVIVVRHFLRRGVENQIQDVTCGPDGFLSYIQNAAYVFTNSFHGSVFSIIFHTNFSAVYQNGMNNRVDGLLSAVGLEQFHCEAGDLRISTPDWEAVDDRLEKLRKASKEFLRYALGV